MVESEREMVHGPREDEKHLERFTSLQPTYEDTVPPLQESDWEFED